MQIQIREVEVVERKDKENLATRYEIKVEELRKQLDFLTREKAKYGLKLILMSVFFTFLTQTWVPAITSRQGGWAWIRKQRS